MLSTIDLIKFKLKTLLVHGETKALFGNLDTLTRLELVSNSTSSTKITLPLECLDGMVRMALNVFFNH
jgi:hypothetical protein